MCTCRSFLFFFFIFFLLFLFFYVCDCAITCRSSDSSLKYEYNSRAWKFVNFEIRNVRARGLQRKGRNTFDEKKWRRRAKWRWYSSNFSGGSLGSERIDLEILMFLETREGIRVGGFRRNFEEFFEFEFQGKVSRWSLGKFHTDWTSLIVRWSKFVTQVFPPLIRLRIRIEA